MLSTEDMHYLSTADYVRSLLVLRTPLFVFTSTLSILTLLKLVFSIRLYLYTSLKSDLLQKAARLYSQLTAAF